MGEGELVNCVCGGKAKLAWGQAVEITRGVWQDCDLMCRCNECSIGITVTTGGFKESDSTGSTVMAISSWNNLQRILSEVRSTPETKGV